MKARGRRHAGDLLMRRILLAVALTASLAPMAPSFFGPLQALLSSLWDASATLDAGCGFDPDGRCTTTPQFQLDEGCGFDPDGRCAAAPQPQLDEGCGADPSGRCQPGS
jgi:hypothetical protein